MESRFLKRGIIGSGAFGTVFEAHDLVDGQRVALKEIAEEMPTWEDCLRLNEVHALQTINHPNIVALKEIIKEGRKLTLVYELLDTDLYQKIKERRRAKRPFSEDEVRDIIF